MWSSITALAFLLVDRLGEGKTSSAAQSLWLFCFNTLSGENYWHQLMDASRFSVQANWTQSDLEFCNFSLLEKYIYFLVWCDLCYYKYTLTLLTGRPLLCCYWWKCNPHSHISWWCQWWHGDKIYSTLSTLHYQWGWFHASRRLRVSLPWFWHILELPSQFDYEPVCRTLYNCYETLILFAT